MCKSNSSTRLLSGKKCPEFAFPEPFVDEQGFSRYTHLCSNSLLKNCNLYDEENALGKAHQAIWHVVEATSTKNKNRTRTEMGIKEGIASTSGWPSSWPSLSTLNGEIRGCCTVFGLVLECEMKWRKYVLPPSLYTANILPFAAPRYAAAGQRCPTFIGPTQTQQTRVETIKCTSSWLWPSWRSGWFALFRSRR